ncbi:MinD/ParA family protein [Streptomyces xiangluensis]|uniref:MinD/ParA family protein n=1 Tax=Streptomyces xiangluensis TaxID=2665720 RepID=A0ABV8YGT8_9ACTN
MTTAAVGLAAGWPSAEQPVVVECDPAGGDLLGRYRLETAPGLMSLAAAARHRAEPGLVWQHTQRLPGGLPVVVGPAGADQARASLAQLTQSGTGMLRRAANRASTVVIADCGRIAPDSPALEVLREADVMLLLARARDDALAHVAMQWPTAARWSRRPCFVLVGDGYPTDEVARELEVEVMARIPEDPKGAAVLGGRPGRRSTPARSPLGRTLAQIADLAASRAAFDPPGPGRHQPRDGLRRPVGQPGQPSTAVIE